MKIPHRPLLLLMVFKIFHKIRSNLNSTLSKWTDDEKWCFLIFISFFLGYHNFQTILFLFHLLKTVAKMFLLRDFISQYFFFTVSVLALHVKHLHNLSHSWCTFTLTIPHYLYPFLKIKIFRMFFLPPQQLLVNTKNVI